VVVPIHCHKSPNQDNKNYKSIMTFNFFPTSTTSTPSTLALAKADLAQGPSPPEGGTWDADLSFDETRRVIGTGFAGTDTIPPEPLMGWMVNPHLQSIDAPTRRQLFQFLMAFPIDESRRKEHMFLGKRTADGTVSTAMVVTQYNHHHHTPRRFTVLPSFKKLHELSLIIKLSKAEGGIPELFTSKLYQDDQKAFTAKSDAIVQNQATWHTEFGPSEPHWYIHVFATNPALQGHGHGSHVLRRICDLADVHETDCYLEAGNERNRTLYEKFGFVTVATKTLEDPHDPKHGAPLTMYLMTRRHHNNASHGGHVPTTTFQP